MVYCRNQLYTKVESLCYYRNIFPWPLIIAVSIVEAYFQILMTAQSKSLNKFASFFFKIFFDILERSLKENSFFFTAEIGKKKYSSKSDDKLLESYLQVVAWKCCLKNLPCKVEKTSMENVSSRALIYQNRRPAACNFTKKDSIVSNFL